jgi:hypothetical protein
MDLTCRRLCCFATTPLLAQDLQLQYWGVVPEHPQACFILTLSRIHIQIVHTVGIPWSLLGHIFRSWGQALYRIWKLYCLFRALLSTVFEKPSLESWMWGLGVIPSGRCWWRYVSRIIWLFHLGSYYGRQGQLQWMCPTVPGISGNIFG